MDFEEIVDFVRNLRGAAASVLWVLVLSGRSLRKQEICRATSYSDKPVDDALAWLEPRGFIQYNGRQYGWSLGHSIPLPFQSLVQSENPAHNRICQDRKVLGVSVVVDHDLHERNGQSVKKQQQTGGKNGELRRALVFAGVRGAGLEDWSAVEVDPAVVYGWAWYCETQRDWMRNPGGYVVRRLQDGHKPEGGYVELARWWMESGGEEKGRVVEAISGREGGRVVDLPAESWVELGRRLESLGIHLKKKVLKGVVELWKGAPGVVLSWKD